MRPVNASELLSVWEQGLNRSLLERALLLLDVACSDGDPADPALLSIGDRDARLLQLREWMFGSRLLNMTYCPQCNECIEWVSQVADMRISPADKRSGIAFPLTADPFHIQYRLPNSYDLAAAAQGNGATLNAKKLLAGCILDAQKDSSTCTAEELPDEVWEQMDQHIAKADPQADISMKLNCPACSHSWELPFDIVSYLWSEIHGWAKHTLQDIAVLAATFGWSEATILGLSPQRRQLYLDIIKK